VGHAGHDWPIAHDRPLHDSKKVGSFVEIGGRCPPLPLLPVGAQHRMFNYLHKYFDFLPKGKIDAQRTSSPVRPLLSAIIVPILF
jgi:hypothetical protein